MTTYQKMAPEAAGSGAHGTANDLPLSRPWEDSVYSLSPDGKWAAAAAPQHTVQVWRTEPPQFWSTYYGHQDGVFKRTADVITTIVWVDNERIVSGSQNGSIHQWQAQRGLHMRAYRNVGQAGGGMEAQLRDVVVKLRE
jgi:WD40 repeat protein